MAVKRSKGKKNNDLFKSAVLLFGILLLSLLALSIYPFVNQKTSISQPYYTLQFDDPAAKMSELTNVNFTKKLFHEAVAYEPLLNQSGTQVHMGFWSGKGNHGSLVRLLDDINNYVPASGEPAHKAIWDEGVQSSLQYAEYVEMNAEEHWYERAFPKDGHVLIYGVNYTDPYDVTFKQADDIWGEYSERYAGMATLFKEATGRPVQVWCFIQGAKANRIFYMYEFPELVKLEQQGAVIVHFAKNQDADWRNASDWYDGTANAPQPLN
jgi:hypothetical protein